MGKARLLLLLLLLACGRQLLLRLQLLHLRLLLLHLRLCLLLLCLLLLLVEHVLAQRLLLHLRAWTGRCGV